MYQSLIGRLDMVHITCYSLLKAELFPLAWTKEVD